MGENKAKTLVDLMGGFGRWQTFYMCFTMWSCCFPAMNHLAIVFISGKLEDDEYQCTDNEIPHYGDQCYSDLNQTIRCTSWKYLTDREWTLNMQWDLICHRVYLLPVLQATYFLGVILGCIIGGIASDAYGRRPTILAFCLIHFITSYSTAFVRDYWLFMILRMFLGGSTHNAWAVIAIVAMEIVPPSKRSMIGTIFQTGWKVGFMILSALAYFIRDWTRLQLAISFTNLIIITYYWVVPESPRWLMSTGKYDEAKKIIIKISKWNKVPINNEFEEGFNRLVLEFKSAKEVNLESSSSSSVVSKNTLMNVISGMWNHSIQLYATPAIRKRMLLMMFPWIAVGSTYYGIFLSVKLVNVSKYLLVFITAAIEIPIQFIFMIIFNKVGRSEALFVTFILSGLFGIGILGTPIDSQISRPILIILGKSFSAVNFQGLGLLVPELFPTNLRNEAFSLLDALSKFGSFLAPFVVDLLSMIYISLPNVFLGIMMLIGAIPFLFFPDTTGQEIPNTTQQLQNQDKYQKNISQKYCCIFTQS